MTLINPSSVVKYYSFLSSELFFHPSSCTTAVAIIEEKKEERRIALGASSWLRSLRTRRWLALTFATDDNNNVEDQVELVASTQNTVTAMTLAIDFAASPAIYSSDVFADNKYAPVPVPITLLGPFCPIWKPFQITSGMPLSPGLLTALGVKQRLDEHVFQVSLSKWLSFVFCVNADYIG